MEKSFLAIKDGNLSYFCFFLSTSMLYMFWSFIFLSIGLWLLMLLWIVVSHSLITTSLVSYPSIFLLSHSDLHFCYTNAHLLLFSKHSYAVYFCLGLGFVETVWTRYSVIDWENAFRRNLGWSEGNRTGQGKKPGKMWVEMIQRWFMKHILYPPIFDLSYLLICLLPTETSFWNATALSHSCICYLP